MTEKNKIILFTLFYFIFFVDFAALFLSISDKEESISLNDFLIIFSTFLLVSIYLSAVNLSKKFREKVFKLSSTFIKDKKSMSKTYNCSLVVGTVIYIMIFVAFFVFSVLPAIYDKLN
jgi:hypothetical protein